MKQKHADGSEDRAKHLNEARAQVERRILMGNADTEGGALPTGQTATGAVADLLPKESSEQRRKKRNEEFARLVHLIEELRREADRWEMLVADWSAARDVLQTEQDADFALIEQLNDKLEEETLDQEAARKLCRDLNIPVPTDADPVELRGILEKERLALLRRTQERQEEIDALNEKIDDAKRNAARLREMADDYERDVAGVMALGSEPDRLQAAIERDLTLVREMASDEASAARQDQYLDGRLEGLQRASTSNLTNQFSR